MKISPALMIAVIGAAAVFFYLQRRNAQRLDAARANVPGLPSVPQSWIEQTPGGYTVVGTTTDLYDIAT